MWLGSVLLLVLLLPVPAHATLPAGATSDPLYDMGYLKCDLYSGVLSNGTGDSTAKLQECIEDAYTNQLAAYLNVCNGIYMVSDTLKLYEWITYPVHGEPYANHVFRGSTACGASSRPKLKITAGSTNFDNIAAPRLMVAYRQFTATDSGGTSNTPPSDALQTPIHFRDTGNTYFNNGFDNIDLDTSNKVGAIGIVMQAAQGNFLLNSTITATGSLAGIYNPPGRNSPTVNVAVNGGKYCVISGTYSSLGLPLVTTAGITMAGITCTNQATTALKFDDNVPPTVVGFNITKSSDGPAIETASVGASFIDGRISMSSAAAGDIAIDNRDGSSNGRNVYLKNTFVQGTTQLVRSGSAITSSTTTGSNWSQIVEYAYTDQFSKDGSDDPTVYPTYSLNEIHFEARSVVDGVLSAAATNGSRNVVSDSPAPPTDLLSRHVWAALPGIDDAGVGCENPVTYGAHAYFGYGLRDLVGFPIDSTTAINAAIAASAATDNRVCLPGGTLLITGTLTPNANTKIFGAGPRKSVIAYKNTWIPTSAVPFIQTVDSASAATYLGFFSMYIKTQPLINDFMYYLRWRAGKDSMTVGVDYNSQFNCACNLDTASAKYCPNTNQPRNALWFSGNGGGRHYGPHAYLPTDFDRNTASRMLFADQNTQPLSFYGMNLEMGKAGGCGVPSTNFEANNANAGIRGYGLKREGVSSTALINASGNVGLFSMGAMSTGPVTVANSAFIRITGASNNIVVAPGVVRDNPVAANGTTMLNAAPTGLTAINTIPYANGFALLRYGTLNDAPFSNAPDPNSPVYATGTAIVTATNQMKMCWQVFDATATLPAGATATGFSAKVNGGAAVGQTSATRSGLNCYQIVFPGSTFAAGNTVTLSYAPGNITAGAAPNPPALAFTDVPAANQIGNLPVLTQTNYAFRSLFGTEATNGPWYTDTGGNYEKEIQRFVQGARFRLRFKVTNTIVASQPKSLTVCASETIPPAAAGPFLLLTDDCVANNTCFADAPDVANGEPTVQLLTPTPGLTFIPGGILEHAADQAPVTLPLDSETEIAVGIQFKATVPVNNVYQYRLCETDSTSLSAYAVGATPQVTAISKRSNVKGGGTAK